MTNATRETTKLNFITDQGSTRAMVRCACRAARFDCAFCAVRVAAGPSPAAVLPAPTVAAALRAAGFLPVKPDRRNARGGEHREFGDGSGISHASAAGKTGGGAADAGRLPADGRREAVPDGEAVPEDEAVPDGDAGP